MHFDKVVGPGLCLVQNTKVLQFNRWTSPDLRPVSSSGLVSSSRSFKYRALKGCLSLPDILTSLLQCQWQCRPTYVSMYLLGGYHLISRGGGAGFQGWTKLFYFVFFFHYDPADLYFFSSCLVIKSFISLSHLFISTISWRQLFISTVGRYKLFILLSSCLKLFISKIPPPLEIKWWPPVMSCVRSVRWGYEWELLLRFGVWALNFAKISVMSGGSPEVVLRYVWKSCDSSAACI